MHNAQNRSSIEVHIIWITTNSSIAISKKKGAQETEILAFSSP